MFVYYRLGVDGYYAPNISRHDWASLGTPNLREPLSKHEGRVAGYSGPAINAFDQWRPVIALTRTRDLHHHSLFWAINEGAKPAARLSSRIRRKHVVRGMSCAYACASTGVEWAPLHRIYHASKLTTFLACYGENNLALRIHKFVCNVHVQRDSFLL